MDGREERIVALRDYPGFQELLDELDHQKVLLMQQIATMPQASLRDYDRLQSGIKWLGFVQEYIATLTKTKVAKDYKPSGIEQLAFNQLMSQFETV